MPQICADIQLILICMELLIASARINFKLKSELNQNYKWVTSRGGSFCNSDQLKARSGPPH